MYNNSVRTCIYKDKHQRCARQKSWRRKTCFIYFFFPVFSAVLLFFYCSSGKTEEEKNTFYYFGGTAAGVAVKSKGKTVLLRSNTCDGDNNSTPMTHLSFPSLGRKTVRHTYSHMCTSPPGPLTTGTWKFAYGNNIKFRGLQITLWGVGTICECETPSATIAVAF